MNKCMNKLIISVVATAVVVGGVAFYGGMKYVQGKAVSDRQQRFGQAGANIGGGFRGQGGAGGGLVSGDIISKDAQSITVKMRDGSSKIVFYSDTTEVSKFVAGTPADLTVGKTVTIIGKTNPDGSVTAISVQLRPNLLSPSPAK
jgi:hypothetical protein